MFTRDDGAWVTRQTAVRGLNPAQMADYARAMAAKLSFRRMPSGAPALFDATGQPIADGTNCRQCSCSPIIIDYQYQLSKS